MEDNLEQKEKEYHKYCFESSTITLLIDFVLSPKLENALVEFVEEKINDLGITKLQVLENDLYVYDRKVLKEEMNSLYERLEEVCLCAGRTFEIGSAWGNDTNLLFCKEDKKICPGRDRNFYRISMDGYVSICVHGDAKETAIHHLLNGIKEQDKEFVENMIRKYPLGETEDCRDCESFSKCLGGRYCDINKYGREKACQLVIETW